MKVLFIVEFLHPAIGGAEYSTSSLLSGLERRGIDCKYATAGNKENLTQANLEETDVIITQLSWSNMAMDLAKKFRKPLIYFFHSWECICNAGHNFYITADCGQTCLNCKHRNRSFSPDMTVANSKFIQSTLLDEHGITSTVVYPVMYLEECYAHNRKPTYISMSRNNYLKGTDRFLRIAERMQDHNFRLVGYGPVPTYLPDNVTFVGPTSQRGCYEDCKIWVAPFRTESFGMSIIEAQYNGIPVVAPNRCAVKYDKTVLSGETIDNPNDMNEWCEKITKIVDSYDAYVNKLANRKWFETFSAEKSIDGAVEVLNHAVKMGAHES